jgi:hypothetical protein
VLRSFAEVESKSTETKSHGRFFLHMDMHRGVHSSVDIMVYRMSCIIYTDSDSSWRLVQD